MNKKVYCIGDIHGRLSALNEVLDKSGFDNDKDRLIPLGDVCDGGSQTKGVINRLLEIKDRIDILGNHDNWFRTWAIPNPDGDNFQYIRTKSLWEPQGGIWTQKSYDNSPFAVPQSHRDFLINQVPYYLDEKNRIFVHGGFNPHKPIEVQSTHDIMWDRKLLTYAKYRHVRGYKHVFVGHTSTQIFKENQVPITHPITHHNLTMCDCGAGWTGRLALVNVDNPKEFWLSGFQEPNFEPGENDGTDNTEEEAWNSLTARGLLAK